VDDNLVEMTLLLRVGANAVDWVAASAAKRAAAAIFMILLLFVL